MTFYHEPGWSKQERAKAMPLLLSILIHGVIIYFATQASLSIPPQRGQEVHRFTVNLVPAMKSIQDAPQPQSIEQSLPDKALEIPLEEPVQEANIPAVATVKPPLGHQEKIVETGPAPQSKPLRKTVINVQTKPQKTGRKKIVAAKKSQPAAPLYRPTAQKTKSTTGKSVSVVSQSIQEKLSLVRLSISRLIAKHFSYPALARRRNWQGRVVVEIWVEPSGQFSKIQVVESSGHRVLDKAATKTVSSLGRLPKTVAMRLEQTVHLRLPIIYRLEG